MLKVTLDDLLALDYSFVLEYLSSFLAKVLEESGARGFVVGVSGGVDSATALTLAARSVGAGRILALIMPDPTSTPREDLEDALSLVGALGCPYRVIDLGSIVEAYARSLDIREPGEERVPLGNLKARARMTLLYYYANKYRYLVLGASDRSEYLIGYFTKYGDGASDVAPLLALYKTQVRAFAREIGVPERVASKPSAPRLWPGHTAEEELGLRYEEIDLVLFSHVDLGIPAGSIPEATGLPPHVVQAVLRLYEGSRHKRSGPLAPNVEALLWHSLKRGAFLRPRHKAP